MTRNIKILSTISCILLIGNLGLTSCDDVLNVESPDLFSESVIWSGEEQALDKYVIGHYGAIRDKSQLFRLNEQFSDALTDIIKSGDWNQAQRYNRAIMLPSYFSPETCGILDVWGGSYDRIKRENEFFRDVEKHKNKYSPEFLKPRIAEMHFIRAFSYYYLIRVFGGVVIRNKVDGPNENDKPRASEAESWQFVIDELKLAVEDLPLSWDSANFGRVTKAAGYGFLSRAALYAKQWDLAADAADKCREAGASLEPAYADVFSKQGSPENLLTVTFFPSNIASNLCTNSDQMFRPSGDTQTHSGDKKILAWLVPTAELADRYEMADGTPFSWAAHAAAPYEGREPRFYASLLYNGAKWERRTIETFVKGADGIQKFDKSVSTSSTVTGYYLKKFITENDHSWDTKGSSHFDIMLRYGEVVLNKAEALANADWGKNKTKALEALNEVRSRVGLPPKDAANLEEFMKLIEQERIVELAGEGFRYWDLRRWRRAMDVLNGTTMHGTRIEKNADDSFSYTQIDVDDGDTRIFMERYYAFSIPITERKRNKALGENNPGW